jgi:hypothetical protein
MSYKLPGESRLTAADKKVYELIKYLVYLKNKYIEEHGVGCFCGAEYSRTVHELDLLQYLVVEDARGGHLDPRFQMDEILEQFAKAKAILDEATKSCIQYCIDVLEEYVQAFELAQEIKRKC